MRNVLANENISVTFWMNLNYGLWLSIHVFPNQIPQNTGMRISKAEKKKQPKYIQPHFTYCLHYKLALGAREDMMCGMFYFMTFQSGAFCFDAMQIFGLQPTEGNPTQTFIGNSGVIPAAEHFESSYKFNHGTIVVMRKTISFGVQTLDNAHKHKIT